MSSTKNDAKGTDGDSRPNDSQEIFATDDEICDWVEKTVVGKLTSISEINHLAKNTMFFEKKNIIEYQKMLKKRFNDRFANIEAKFWFLIPNDSNLTIQNLQVFWKDRSLLMKEFPDFISEDYQDKTSNPEIWDSPEITWFADYCERVGKFPTYDSLGAEYEGIILNSGNNGFHAIVFTPKLPEEGIFICLAQRKSGHDGGVEHGNKVKFTLAKPREGKKNLTAIEWVTDESAPKPPSKLPICEKVTRKEWDDFLNCLNYEPLGVVSKNIKTDSKEKDLGDFKQLLKRQIKDNGVKYFETILLSERTISRQIFRNDHEKRDTHTLLLKKINLNNYYLIRKKSEWRNPGDWKIPEPYIVRLQTTIAELAFNKMLGEKEDWIICSDEKPIKSNPQLETNDILNIMYSLVPKNAENVPRPHPWYHGMNAQVWGLETKRLMEELANNNYIIHISFQLDLEELHSAISSAFPNELERDEVLFATSITIPLILEYIRSIETTKKKESGKIGVCIFGERHGNMFGGSKPLPTILQNLSYIWKDRSKGAILQTTHQILDKDPLEHPYLAFPDIVGRIYDKEEVGLDPGQLDRWRNKVNCYDLNVETAVIIDRLLRLVNNPKEFITAMYELKGKQYFSLYDDFLGSAVKESVEALDDNGWRNVMSVMRERWFSTESHAISKKIIDATKDYIPFENEPASRFDFIVTKLSVLEHANESPWSLISEGTSMIELHEVKEIHLDRTQIDSFETITLIHLQNFFDFSLSTLTDDFEEWFENHKTDMTRHFRARTGAVALGLALAGEHGKAEKYESYIRDRTRDIRDKKFRFCREVELQIERKNHEGALNTIFEKSKSLFPNETKDIESFIAEGNPYLLVAMLRTIAESDEEPPANYLERVKKIFSHLDISILTEKLRHPSQRLSYWYLKVLQKYDWISQSEKDENTEAALNTLLNLRKEKGFKHNVLGIILACELLDLKESGDYQELKDFDAHAFLQQVLDNKETVDSTREWVDNNYPDEEDWLKPLKFNYR